MSRLSKSLLLYLLMLAIPAQGFAASTLLFCGPVHQRGTTAQESDHHSGHGHSYTRAADHQAHLLPAVSVNSPGLASIDAAGDSTNSDGGLGIAGEPGKSSCSACAACCMGVAAPATEQRLQPADPAIERTAATPFRSIGFVTDGPRRPPRSFLA
jgi:hypothetical protein